ncbi:MAG: hypothetical protein UY76_C0021G0006 [Candidatus Uhrbacteria bacterium GW2011_GWA2_52_8d]|uniref:Uncharacterized protein n=1 Tax=Candidatus Uhrbacteria bacterium GW2011_GWA2_52_8d TaxID=1618979 RepID=A0A0G1XP52_9BACT|nr:MAG: hypothetical protein UY76_C0021G0006 [Candidatus Uhrbacteria bacterium GW2011_GWA2_52_8d]
MCSVVRLKAGNKFISFIELQIMRTYFYTLLCLLLLTPTSVIAAELTNPLGTTDIRTVIGRLIQAILGITGAVALLMFIYGGFLWLISAGESKKVEKGKDVMKWAILGIAVIVGAYTIVSTIVTALESGTIG